MTQLNRSFLLLILGLDPPGPLAYLYKKAMNNMLSERRIAYHVCRVCGYISEDAAPENCPVCGAVKTKFKVIE